MGSSAAVLHVVRMEWILGPLLLLYLFLPYTLCSPCRPSSSDYNEGKCQTNTLLVVVGVCGVIFGPFILICCFLHCYEQCHGYVDHAPPNPDAVRVERVVLKEKDLKKDKQIQILKPSPRLDGDKLVSVGGRQKEETNLTVGGVLALESLLRQSASRGELEGVKALLDSGARLDAEDEEGHTALYLACNENKVDVVKLLLARGASPHVVPSPLAVAIRRGHYQAAQAVDTAIRRDLDDPSI